jgi:hypothetical protein
MDAHALYLVTYSVEESELSYILLLDLITSISSLKLSSN